MILMRFSLSLFVFLIFSFTNSFTQPAPKNKDIPESPNIILIIVDDMGWADLGVYGQSAYSTPNLDRMAAEGIRFTNAYAGSAVCAPSRSVLMTGQHMGHTPVRGNTGGIPLPDKAVTLAEVLQKVGYTTGGFGKWGLGDLDTEGVPENQGFDRFFGYYHQIHAHYYYPEYLVDTGEKMPLSGNKDFYKNIDIQGGVSDSLNGRDLKHSHYLIFNELKQWIQANKNQPFFAYAPLTPPHARYEIPENDPAWQKVKDKDWGTMAKVHAAFNMVLDRHIGELFKLLEDVGIEKETVVLFASDNGASKRFEGSLNSSGPLKGRKTSMYEGGIRVPLIVRWTGTIEAGQVSNLPTYFPDIMPTLADIAGANSYLPHQIDGISFLPALTGQRLQEMHDFMYWELPKYDWGKQEYAGTIMQAVRHGKWKLVRHDNNKVWELYDLSKDRGETHNLAGERANLVKKINHWVEDNRDPIPEQVEPKMLDGKKYR